MVRPDLEVRNLTPDEISEFSTTPCEVNWGVFLHGRPVACFQAEDDGDGWLAVHATVKRRSLHPSLTLAYAKTFCDQLLAYGAAGLKAEIPTNNRAAVRIARAGGLREVSRNESFITMVRYGKEETTGTETDALPVEYDVHGMGAVQYS